MEGMETASVKYGPKNRHVKIPDGWKLVKESKCIHGDKFLDLFKGYWAPVDFDDIGMESTDFDFLIRRIKKVE